MSPHNTNLCTCQREHGVHLGERAECLSRERVYLMDAATVHVVVLAVIFHLAEKIAIFLF